MPAFRLNTKSEFAAQPVIFLNPEGVTGCSHEWSEAELVDQGLRNCSPLRRSGGMTIYDGCVAARRSEVKIYFF